MGNSLDDTLDLRARCAGICLRAGPHSACLRSCLPYVPGVAGIAHLSALSNCRVISVLAGFVSAYLAPR